jgi:hypothetical protein
MMMMAIMFHASQTFADPCASINDSDERAMCRAEVTGNASYCSAIRDHDKREHCRAKVGKK